ncbi:MAG: histidine kinase dimerization/phospho-acceptor domain-containing protein [Hydrogeniiclostridium mannosilyticum]
MSHEIKTPLAVIRIMQSFAKDSLTDEQRKEYAETIAMRQSGFLISLRICSS